VEEREEDPLRREEKGLFAIHWEERELSFAEAMAVMKIRCTMLLSLSLVCYVIQVREKGFCFVLFWFSRSLRLNGR